MGIWTLGCALTGTPLLSPRSHTCGSRAVGPRVSVRAGGSTKKRSRARGVYLKRSIALRFRRCHPLASPFAERLQSGRVKVCGRWTNQLELGHLPLKGSPQ
jgi:hypothetical protein